MPSYSLGSIEGKIRISYDGAGTQQAKKDTEEFKKGLGDTGQATRDLGTQSIVAGGAVVAGLGLAVKAASNFEKTLSGVKAVSGATADEMQKIRDKAMQIGQDTSFSSSEAAGAMEELVKAGIKVEDVLNGAADATVSLAAAGGIDLPRAAEIASAAMNNFGLAAKDLPHVADLIAGAANASAIDVGDFGESMKQAGAVANLVGLSFDDLALAITAMGNAGIKGSDAGTSLKTFLSNLQPGTKKQANLMNDLGITTKDAGNKFFDAAGHVKSMAEIGGVLEKALHGMSDAQKQSTLETLFGSDAIRAAAVISKEGAKGFQDLSVQINAISAADVAKTRLDNFAGTMENLKGTLENTAISIGQVLIPVLGHLAKMINVLAGWFNGLPGPVKEALTWFLAVGGSLLLINGIFIKVGLAMMSFISNFAKVAGAVSDGMKVITKVFMANPWILAVVAAAAAVALIIVYWDEIVAFLTKVWNWIANLAKSIWGGITDFFSSVWNAVTSAVKAAWNGIVSFLKTVWQWIVDNVWPILSPIVTIIKGILEVLLAIIQGIINTIAAIVEGIWHQIVLFTSVIWAEFLAKITAIWQAILVAFHFIWDPIVEFFTKMWEGITVVAEIAWTAFLDKLTAIWNTIVDAFRNVWQIITGVFTAAWKAIDDAVGGMVRNAITKLGELISWLGSLPGKALTWLFDVGANLLKGMYNGIVSGLSWLKDKIISIFTDVVNGIKDFFGISSPSKLFAEYGKFTIQGFVVGAESMQSELDKTMQAVLNPDMSLVQAQQVGMAMATNALPTSRVAAASYAGSGGSSQTNVTHIDNLTLNVAGNLDPSNPVGFRQTIVNIKDAIRQVDRDSQ